MGWKCGNNETLKRCLLLHREFDEHETTFEKLQKIPSYTPELTSA
jgi:hypothetical protein